MNRYLITSILFGLFISCSNIKESDTENSYLEEWEKFNTELIKEEKSFEKYEEFEKERKNIRLVKYQSDSLKLKGLLNIQNIKGNSKQTKKEKKYV